MSAVLDAAPPTQTPKRLAPVEYVAALPIEDQEAILFYLVKEMVRENGEHGWIRLTNETEHLGSFLPAKGERELLERRGPKLTPEEYAELQQRLDNLDGCTWLTTEELLAAMREAARPEAATPG